MWTGLAWARVREAGIAVAVALLLLWAAPKIDPGSDLRTHAAAQAQATLTGGFYSPEAQKEITVLLIDDATISGLQTGWPLPYATHARWLGNIGTIYKPRAIFVDITFTQERADATLPSLVDALCKLRSRGIPVFLAALADPVTGQLRLRTGLDNPPGQPPCFSLVGVNYESHAVDRFVWTYPLWGKPAAGRPGITADSPRSAALALAQDIAHLEVARFDEDMALTWGVNNVDLPRYAEWCRQSRGGLREMPPASARKMFGAEEADKPICPYSRVLTMRDLASESETSDAELHALIDGRFLMIGAALTGFNDNIVSPVHGAVPGVFMHAMALDNLLVYKGRYKRAFEWSWPPPMPLVWLGIFIVLVAHVVHRWVWPELEERIPRWWGELATWAASVAKKALRAVCATLGVKTRKTRHTEPRLSASPERTTFAGKALFVLRLARDGLEVVCLKVFQILLSSLVIMLLVVAAQHFFAVGILPLVDLLLMALVAEWLGWTQRVSDFVFRRHSRGA